MTDTDKLIVLNKHTADTADFLFSEPQWEEILTNSIGERIYKPKFMLCPVEWHDIHSIKKAKVPYVRIVYSQDGDILQVEAYPGIVREIPIFFKIKDNKLIVSDSVYKLIDSGTNLNKLSLIEFISFGYVTSNRTLFDDIYSVEAGTILYFKHGETRIKIDYLYNSSPIFDSNFLKLQDSLQAVSEGIFNDLIKTLKGKRVILPLSAGYDSRFIASMLKMGGFENVTCFAWGKPGNKDIEISRKIAEKFGFEWVVVDYSERSWRDAIETEWIQSSLLNGSNSVSISGVASLPFQKKLSEYTTDYDDVVLPGHTGDFISGGHVPYELSVYSKPEHIVSFIKDKHIISSPGTDMVDSELLRQVKFYNFYTKDYRIYETWESRERQSKFITNSNRYYEYLNISWNMPLWDYRFVKFWDSVPLEYKKESRLYKQFLENNIFRKAGVNFGLKKNNQTLKNKLSFLKRYRHMRRIWQLIRKIKPTFDEFGFDRSLSYLYSRTKQKYPAGFKEMKTYCDEYGFKAPAVQYSYLARSVLAMLLENFNAYKK